MRLSNYKGRVLAALAGITAGRGTHLRQGGGSLAATSTVPWFSDTAVPGYVWWTLAGIGMLFAVFLTWMWFANRACAKDVVDEFKDYER